MTIKADKRWLPVGHLDSWNLHIEHHGGTSAGAFTGGGRKLVWHITVSPWGAIDSMVDVLIGKGAEPHLVIGGRKGRKDPVVVQLLPFDEAGRSLQHTLGPETNRANCIQVEICANPGRGVAAVGRAVGDREGSDLFSAPGLGTEQMRHLLGSAVADGDGYPICLEAESHPMMAAAFASGVASWGDATYEALGNLARLVEHRVEIPRRVPRAFSNPTRFTATGFVRVAGHVGHSHAPGNTHIDPTANFNGARLLTAIKAAPNEF